MKLRVNAPVDQAQPLLERVAAVVNMIAITANTRDRAIAAANAKADATLQPLTDELAMLRAQLQPWWARVGAGLLTGKRKTAELFGCLIGTKAGRTSLSMPGDDDASVAALTPHRWAKPYLVTTTKVDKVALKKALEGKHGEQLKALGFSLPAADEVFVLERVAQEGAAA